MGKIISIVNQKGGVGKSTTCVNLAAYLGLKDNSCLVIDLDSQGNLTTGFGFRKKSINFTVYEVLIGQASAADSIIQTSCKFVDILPATSSMAGAELDLNKLENRALRLKTALLTLKNYDYILIDCPPSLSLVTINALSTSDSVIIPMLAEYYSLEGLSQLMETIKRVKAEFNSKLTIEGILFTMFDNRLTLAKDVVKDVENHFPEKVFKTKIPRNVTLSEAPSYGKPCIYYDRYSKGAIAYQALGTEILNRHNKENSIN